MQLYASFVIAALALMLSPTDGMPQRLIEKMDAATDVCISRFKISSDDIETFKASAKLKDENSSEGTCFVQCVMEELGMIKDGVFSIEQKIALAKDIFKDYKLPDGTAVDYEKMRKGLAECVSAATGESTCAKNYSIWTCMGNKRGEVGL